MGRRDGERKTGVSHPEGLWQHYQGSLGGRECMWIECSDPWYSLTSQGTLGAPDGRARPICSGPSYALLLTQGLVLAGSTGERWTLAWH